VGRADEYHEDPDALWMGCPQGLRWAESVLDAMRLPEGGLILDLGTGPGLTAAFIAREYGCRVVATEAWPEHFPLENIRERAASLGVGDRVLPVLARADGLPFADDTFDAVFSYCAYHYMAPDPAARREIARVLRAGGALGVCSPAGRTDSVPDHIRSFLKYDRWDLLKPPEVLARGMGEAGLAPEVVEHVPGAYELWEAAQRAAQPVTEEDRMERKMVLDDRGRWLSVARVIARKPSG